MKKTHKRLSPEEADLLGFSVKEKRPADDGNPRYYLTNKEWLIIANIRESKLDEKLNAKTKPGVKPPEPRKRSEAEKKALERSSVFESFDLAAWNLDGTIMSIEEFCKYHKFDPGLIHDYRLCTHTKVPTYNISWKKITTLIKEDLTKEFLTVLIQDLVKPVELEFIPLDSVTADGAWDRATYTDWHIGMDPDAKGKALYPEAWDENAIYDRIRVMARKIIENRTGHTLYLEDLGDFMDGMNGQTVRKGHNLPQLMSNQEAYRCGINSKVMLIDILAPYFKNIYSLNITDDNHAGDFGWMVNEAAKDIIELKYPDKVVVTNYRQFMNFYTVDGRVFVLCHGKDGEALKFGFGPHLKPADIEKIDQYIKYEDLYRYGGEIQFCKGDSHQCLFDMASSDDFDYNNYPASSPSSEWVQTNYKKGRSGFVMEHYVYGANEYTREIFWFNKKGLKR